MYGGGDNLVAVGMYEGFNHAMWNQYMLPMTLITLIGMAIILLFFVKDEKIQKIELRNKTVNWVAVFALLAALVLVFKSFLSAAAVLIVLAYFFMAKPQLLFKNIPYKLMGIWTLAFLFGKLSGLLMINIADNFTNISFILLCLITIGFTIFCTNTATAACVMGVYFLLFPLSPITFCLLLKYINVGYLTIYHNTCLAAGSGYGISQKQLFKVGLSITLFQLLVIFSFLVYWM